MPLPKNILFFDIETGGLHARESSLASISWGVGQEQPQSVYAKRPVVGSKYSEWARENVWRKVLRQQNRTSELQMLKQFIGTLEQHRGPIAGWNIGYTVGRQGQIGRAGGFDIPFLMSRAAKYGLEEQMGAAFQKRRIIDIGQKQAWNIAREVGKAEYSELLDPDIRKQVLGYIKRGQGFAMRGYDPAEALSRSGTRLAGWKQESVHSLMGLGRYAAHSSEADIKALQEMYYSGKPLRGRRFVQQWHHITLKNRLISAARYGPGRGIDPTTFYEGLRQRGLKYGVGPEWEEQLAAMVGDQLEAVKAGKGFKERMFTARGNPLTQVIDDRLIPYMKRTKGPLIALGALAFYGIANPLGWFSAKDDEYNTIEGLPERGMSGTARKWLTDFGSGYQEDRHTAREEFSFFRLMLGRYGQKAGTAHKRILIPREILTEEELTEELGFVPVSIAIPEAGESRSRSFRHPKNTYHIHEHGDMWSMHKDRHASSTMLALNEPNPFKKLGLMIAGIPHIITEGIPGAAIYAWGQLTGTAGMQEKLETEVSPAYWKSVRTFSGWDDAYNTIEGLRHGGMAGDMRSKNTDFGSGWVRRAVSAGMSQAKITGAARRLGKEVIETAGGEAFILGRTIGEGGFGTVKGVQSLRTGGGGVYKAAKEGADLGLYAGGEAGAVFGPRSLVTMMNREMYQKAMSAVSAATPMTANIQREFARGAYKTPLHYEAAMQSMAAEAMPGAVPKVLGVTDEGFIQEFAGRAIRTAEERTAAAKFIQETYKPMIAGQLPVMHFDPDITNLVVSKRGGFKLIDWGVAAPVDKVMLQPEAALGYKDIVEMAAKKALEGVPRPPVQAAKAAQATKQVKHTSIFDKPSPPKTPTWDVDEIALANKMASKNMQQATHKQTVQSLFENAKMGGRRHTRKQGK